MDTETKAGRRNSAKDADELQSIANLAGQIQEVVNGLLTDDEAEPSGSVDGGEADETAEGQKSQAEYVDAYRSAVKQLIELEK